MRVADIKGSNLILVNQPNEVEALLDALGPLHRCGQCKAFYVLATGGTYTHAYGVSRHKPDNTDQVHVHIEPDRRR